LIVDTPTGRRMRPHVLATIASFASTTIRTNALGYRNPEIGPKGFRRVLFLGDSIAFGQGVQEEVTFVRRIETMSRSSDKPLETINASVPGIGLENELAILLETGLSTHPDDVVLCFYLNDALPSPGVRILPVPPGLEWSRLALYLAESISLLASRPEEELDPREARSWLAELRARYPANGGDPVRDRTAFNQLMQDAYPDWGSAWTDGAWRRINPVLAELKRHANLHRFNLWIVGFPVAHQVDAEFVEDTPQRRLGDSSRRLRVPYLDLLPILRDAKRSSNDPLFRDHCHLTASGHAVVARAVLDFIAARGARPAP
jgi:lysophospholipase L1-like esterase